MNDKIGKQLRLMEFDGKVIKMDGWNVVATAIFIFTAGIMAGLILAGIIHSAL